MNQKTHLRLGRRVKDLAYVSFDNLPVHIVAITILETRSKILFDRQHRYYYAETGCATPAFTYHGFADFVAAFTALIFRTPSSASQSSSAFLPLVA